MNRKFNGLITKPCGLLQVLKRWGFQRGECNSPLWSPTRIHFACRETKKGKIRSLAAEFFILLLIISSSAAFSATRYPKLPPEPPSWQTINTNYFDGITIDGPFDIEVISNTNQNRAEIFANREDLKQLNFAVNNSTLTVSPNSRYNKRQPKPARWLMRIYTNNLRLICLYDSANLTALSLDSRYLFVVAADDSQLYIRGMIGVLQVSVPYGNPYIDIAWVNCTDLLMDINGGSIALAGTTQFLNARLAGDTHLDIKQLRIHKIWLQTTDNAVAEVVATHTLRAFASGNSNILYYTTPTYLTDFSEISGNVLQMGHWY
jgi:hypothetical protein